MIDVTLENFEAEVITASMSLPVLVDLNNDGEPDVRAEFPLIVVDSNHNLLIDAGDHIHFAAPRVIPLGTGVRLVWCGHVRFCQTPNLPCRSRAE